MKLMKENLDNLTLYLSKKSIPAAIADKKCNLLWSSNDKIWNSTIKRISHPVDTERVFTAVFDGEKCPVTATEFKLENGEKIYVFEAFSSGMMSQLMRKSDFADKLKNGIDRFTIEIRNIIGLGVGLSNSLTNRTRKEQRKTIESQFLCASDLLAQSMNISCYLDDELSYGVAVTSNINPVFDTLYRAFSTQLSRFGREINYVAEKSTGQVNISERKLAVMLLNLIQNAFLYSPKNSQITMHLTYTRNKAKIKISNFKRKDIVPSDFTSVGLGKELSRCIVESGNGTIEFNETDKKMIVEIEIPVVNGVSKINLESSFLSTPHDRFSPIGVFINKVVKHETEED